MKSVLCIEDNAEIRILVEASLPNQQVAFAKTLAEAFECLARRTFDLLILDLELPDGDGLKFLTKLVQPSGALETPVFILTSKAESANQVIAFSLGAEDFIAKPFDPLILRARVEAKLRKLETSRGQTELLRVKDLTIDIPKQRVSITKNAQVIPVELTSIEFKLLLTLARAPERVFSRNALLDEVWGSSVSITDRTVDTHIAHLRKKIVASVLRIETVINEGYRLQP